MRVFIVLFFWFGYFSLDVKCQELSETSGHLSSLHCKSCVENMECITLDEGILKLNYTLSFTNLNLPPEFTLTAYQDYSLFERYGSTTVDSNDYEIFKHNGCTYYQYNITLNIIAHDICNNNGEIVNFNFILGLELPQEVQLLPLLDNYPDIFDSDCFDDISVRPRSYYEQSIAVCCNGISRNRININSSEEKASDLVIHPNPFSDFVSISNNGLVKIEIFNSSGDKVFSKNSNKKKITINLGNYPVGIYFFHMYQEDHTKVIKKVIKY